MRKYRVMLIDDEQSARKLMRASIGWESLNMEVVGEAASGIEAINVIDEMRPDIAFVDIPMPFMNGIEFTEVATARYPNLIIIIMTALDQFEYARKCVSLPVFEYMLKPMVRSEKSSSLKNGISPEFLSECTTADSGPLPCPVSSCGSPLTYRVKFTPERSPTEARW